MSLNLSKTFGLIRPMTRSLLLSTSTLTRFAVNGVEAALALDFIGGEYRTANTATTFADAFTGTSPKLTYSTAAGSNSTMTQGYGPELVENGHFTSNTSGWSDDSSAGGSLSWNDGGHLDLTHSGGVVRATQNIAVTQGKTYAIEFRLVAAPSSSGLYIAGSNVANFVTLGVGTHTVYYTATATGSVALQARVFAAGIVTIDNISVREAPKIVWAPHNLLDYSEDFTQWGAGRAGTGTPPVVTPNAGTAPDGSLGAHRVQLDLGSGTTSGDFSQLGTLPAYGGAGVPYTLSVWMKSYDGNSYDVMLDFNGAAEQIETITNQWRLVSTTVLSLDTVARPVNVVRLRGGTGTSNTADILIYGAHVYRSDLGGMHPVPGAATGFETYVPTSGSAEYLPRVGHHVYNGSAWVNEGLLIESEPRTNYILQSENLLDAAWSGSATVTDNGDGSFNIAFADATIQAFQQTNAGATGSVNTVSVDVKKDNVSDFDIYVDQGGTTGRIRYNFDTDTFAFAGSAITDYGSSDVGDGWRRLWVTADGTGIGAFKLTPSSTASGEERINVRRPQHELGSTPSSYMPTNGGTYTRTAQSLTVPPAEFGWPEPEYIGPELVVDGSGNWVGDFDVAADVSEWTDPTDGRSTASFASNKLRITNDTSGYGYAYQVLSLQVGRTYTVSWDVSAVGTGYATRVFWGSAEGFTNGGVSQAAPVTGTQSVTFVAKHGTTYFHVQVYTAAAGPTIQMDFDNISVREINPLSVSIQMDGRMTYADEDVGVSSDGTSGEVLFSRWRVGASEYITSALATNTGTGEVVFIQEVGGVFDTARSNASDYTPGINVPFNISSRHGSTFVNGAVDGVALTADTTPTALPDLSGTDLEIAQDFMGTIGQFRQFAGDIGDAGLVTATNPSTEPTLSLTFDGTNGSFYNLSWSE